MATASSHQHDDMREREPSVALCDGVGCSRGQDNFQADFTTLCKKEEIDWNLGISRNSREFNSV